MAAKDHPSLILPPPTYPAALFLLALVLDGRLLPGFPAEATWTVWPGAVLVVLGLGFAGWAVLCFVRAGTHVEPHKPTLVLVTRGPFRLSRNPIYTSFFLLFVGMGLVFRLEWTIALLPLLWACMRFLVIAPEENFLRKHFGPAYADYQKRVRRWL